MGLAKHNNAIFDIIDELIYELNPIWLSIDDNKTDFQIYPILIALNEIVQRVYFAWCFERDHSPFWQRF